MPCFRTFAKPLRSAHAGDVGDVIGQRIERLPMCIAGGTTSPSSSSWKHQSPDFCQDFGRGVASSMQRCCLKLNSAGTGGLGPGHKQLLAIRCSAIC